jgi:hypothetical protein
MLGREQGPATAASKSIQNEDFFFWKKRRIYSILSQYIHQQEEKISP